MLPEKAKTIGIIGGLGPQTTAAFYLDIAFSSQEINTMHRPSVLIHSVPLPFALEEDAIARGRGAEQCLPYILDAARRLERAGADFLVMPCNSLHMFIENLRNSVGIPVLSIVEETTKFLLQHGIRKVGILATSLTIDRKLYEASLAEENIQQVAPDDYQQVKIGRIIHNLVSNRGGNEDRKSLMKIIESLEEKGLCHVILACTDLQLLLPEHPDIKIYDTMKIFADASLRKLLSASS